MKKRKMPTGVLRRGHYAAGMATTALLVGGTVLAGTPVPRPNSWPPAMTPSSLPQPDPIFRGRIAETAGNSVPSWPKSPTAPRGAPNVVVILIDDAGFAATDLFGAPIATPELDRFAAQGLRYNDFNVTAICSPTRAALLTGDNPHRVGIGDVVEAQGGYPAYNMTWKESTACVCKVLRDDGYSTAAFGKWHDTPMSEWSPVGPFNHWPTGLGFEYFYGFMQGADNQFEPRLYQDTTVILPPKTPAQGYYFTTDITNQAIAWIHTHEALAPNKPYFLYFATGATHFPQQVEKKWIAKYKGRFHEGWDQLRREIFERQKQLGVIPANTVLTPRPKQIPAWDSLSADQKKLYAYQMQVYAGFMSETDHEVGRLLKAIEAEPDAGNTLVVYILGDNGASGEGGLEGSDHVMATTPTGQPLPLKMELSNMDRLGGPTLDNVYSAAWAWAMDTPFRWMKQIASSFGGTRDPMIVVWPDRIRDRGQLRTQFVDVTDVVPTIYQVAGIRIPSMVDGIKQQPLDGISFAYTFNHPHMPSRRKVQIFETFGNRAIYDDGWVASARHGLPWSEATLKAILSTQHFSKDRWRLYHVADDFSEAQDLAAQYPGKLAELKKVFEQQAWERDVYPLGGSFADPQHAPSLIRGRHTFVFYPSLPYTAPPALGSMSMDNLFNGQERITAHLSIPAVGASGTIVSYGSTLGGFALYVKGGKLVYDYNFDGIKHYIISSNVPMPTGHVTVTYRFDPNQSHFCKGKDCAVLSGGGEGSLYVNGRLVGKGVVSEGLVYYGAFGVGRSYDSPVSQGYSGVFPFSGKIENVVVTLPKKKRPYVIE